jgi:5-methylcytosine-specific restriction enzyme subunit McrC
VKRISIPEFGRIPRAQLGGKLLQRLQAFDEKHAHTTKDCVFDWSQVKYIRALNYVGVVQVPGLVIEVLPKIDNSPEDEAGPFLRDDKQALRAQHNLLYMLSFTRKIPIRDRDLASLRLQRLPLLEALIMIFAEQLLGELGKGLDRSYVHREENARFLKGKLLLAKHIRHNAAHKERVFIGYDEFISDTWLNRILKAACRHLLGIARSSRTQRRLREAMLHFADVSDRRIQDHHFAKVHLDRNTERFSTLLGFCKIVLKQSAATPSHGKTSTFSLLFPMETLFEEFIAEFIRKHSEEFGLHRNMLHVQATRRRKHLLQNARGAGKFQLKPDIIIDSALQRTKVIIDTKWKRLKSDKEDAKNGVLQADLYQLYAYAHRYDSPDNVLLYPKVRGVTAKTYTLVGEEGKRIRIEFIDINRDLRREKKVFGDDLRRVIHGLESV